jgi:ubiquitin-conjugating enzyme E2 Z
LNINNSILNLNVEITSYLNNSISSSILTSLIKSEKENNIINNKFIPSTTIKRLASDVKKIIKEPLTTEGIYYKHDENNMLIGYAMIVGPKNTPYENGYYFFEFKYPCNYPFSPPEVKYYTNDDLNRFNPNLYKNGKVCISILNTWHGEQWTGCQTITSVLLTLSTLFTEKPLLNEPGVLENNPDIYPYTKSIEFKNLDFCICETIISCSNKNNKFNIFYSEIKELFLNNYDSIINKIKNKINSPDDNTIFYTKLYHMKVSTNYKNLLSRIDNVKKIIIENTSE